MSDMTAKYSVKADSAYNDYIITECETGSKLDVRIDNLADIGCNEQEIEEIRRGYDILLESPAIDYIHGLFDTFCESIY